MSTWSMEPSTPRLQITHSNMANRILHGMECSDYPLSSEHRFTSTSSSSDFSGNSSGNYAVVIQMAWEKSCWSLIVTSQANGHMTRTWGRS